MTLRSLLSAQASSSKYNNSLFVLFFFSRDEDDGIGGESVEAGENTVGDARRRNAGDVNGNRKKRGRKPGSSKKN